MNNNFFDFVGGDEGQWRVVSMSVLKGEALEGVSRLSIEQSAPSKIVKGRWSLKGFTSNVRYTEKREREKLNAVQVPLGRAEATCAALIPIRKNEQWWNLAQDERRKIFEAQSHHTEIGLKYLPAVARKLYHCRDIGEPFDFLTWFEFAPAHANMFNDLLFHLRQSDEWSYIDREIDIRLVKN